MKRFGRLYGYILLESLVALAVLSVGTIAINRALYQVMLTRALARDYCRVRFLLEELIAAPQLRYWTTESTEEGQFEGELSRFQWVRTIEIVPIPLPSLPEDLPYNVREELTKKTLYCGRVTVTIKWTRAGNTYERSLATLIPPNRLWLPENDEGFLRLGEGEETQEDVQPK